MTILFATTNARKIGEAQVACKDFGITVKQVEIDMDEIQSHDPVLIARDKATRAFELTNKPVVVTDTSWSIPALNGFPGGYMKDVSAWFAPEDFLALMTNKKDRSVSFTETIVYADNTQVKVFSKEFWGEIAPEPRGIGESIEQVAMFEGHTIGERRSEGKFSHDPKDYVWYQFAEWFKLQAN